MNDLVVRLPYGPDTYLLQAYEKLCKTRATMYRAHFQRMLDRSDALWAGACEDKLNKELACKITDMSARIHAQAKGVPLTDDVDVDPRDIGLSASETMDDPQASAAQKLLLKRAYRAAVSLAHPDKGGSDEEFDLVTQAYAARDLQSLTDYVVAKNRSLLDRIAHWENEGYRPAIAWKRFQSTSVFPVVQALEMGKREEAMTLTHRILKARLLELTLQELSHNFNPRR